MGVVEVLVEMMLTMVRLTAAVVAPAVLSEGRCDDHQIRGTILALRVTRFAFASALGPASERLIPWAGVCYFRHGSMMREEIARERC